MDVELLRWPIERDKRERLRASGRPRLLLIEAGVEPPQITDLFEDWVRIPADRLDVRARISGLLQRIDIHHHSTPQIDETGMLVHGYMRVPLPPIEAKILGELMGQMGKVVRRSDLIATVWPEDPPDRNVLDVHLVRLRRRVTEAGLHIRTVRSRGLLLERI